MRVYSTYFTYTQIFKIFEKISDAKYLYLYIYMYIYIYIYIHKHIYIYIYIHAHSYTSIMSLKVRNVD